ncbi:MAG TPA: hypothetical protein VF070_46230 [Streptosporangiaceae bacterium]
MRGSEPAGEVQGEEAPAVSLNRSRIKGADLEQQPGDTMVLPGPILGGS